MTTATSAPVTDTDKNLDKTLDASLATVAGEIARTDGKASLLLAFNGAALAGLASVVDRRLPIVTQACGAAAVLALAAAAVLLLLVVRPRLRGDDRASFPYWARLDDNAIRACMQGDTRAARIRVLSRIAVSKFRQLRRAVDLSLAALVLLLLAALGALV
ncbi:integral membrane plasmid transfer protein (plasmid) [Streptomyces sp. RLB1-9]|uniref:Pycsar system effector family protein n=1 Tax=Streptomyces sp. RLB1-9 TaxID=2594454 RepID=UPI00116448C4|nr:Pycsar system effector family protein [Streptomyces sp. RLB1-9]QDN94803.1 integral membrane plasmid transfer protein [Streptomyces sp. RLB1-9]